jgi:hypothetical protein
MILLVEKIDLYSSYHEDERPVACLYNQFSTGKRETRSKFPMFPVISTNELAMTIEAT